MGFTSEEEERLWHTLFGNGKTGLVEEVRTMQRSLYANPKTGEKGLIADVAEIKRIVIQIRAFWWFIGAVVLSVQFLQVIGVLGR